MAAVSGKAAKVEYGGGKVVNFSANWSIDIGTNMLDVTTHSTGTKQWRDFIAGLSDWSGSIGGFEDPTSTGLDDMRTNTLTPTTAQLILYVDKSGGENYRGSSLVETFSVGADIDGAVDTTVSFRGTGALAYSSAT